MTWATGVYAVGGPVFSLYAGGEQLPAEVTTQLEEGGFLPLVPHELQLDYSYFTAEQVLKVRAPSCSSRSRANRVTRTLSAWEGGPHGISVCRVCGGFLRVHVTQQRLRTVHTPMRQTLFSPLPLRPNAT